MTIIEIKILFQKLRKVLDKITDPKNTIIHLDLYDTEQHYLMTDFLFSFLITKFYTNFEDILHISDDIYIYIEIPNEFTNFLQKFQILNFFKKANKTKEMKLSELKSSFQEINNYEISPVLNRIFNHQNQNNQNIKKEDLLYKYISIENPTYYQIEIFCKCIKSYHFNELDRDNENIFLEKSEKIIKCIQLFTKNLYSDFIINKKEYKKEDSLIDILTNIDDNNRNKNIIDKYFSLIFFTKSGFYELNNEILTNLKSKDDFLNELKKIMSIDNPINKDGKESNNEKDGLLSLNKILGNYIINSDNFIKMALIFYRINANIPVILMGETGCGKTSLIKKLNEIKNNGKSTLEIMQIHSGITDQDIINKVTNVNKIAETKENEKIWLFFDEINTCNSLGLLSEIFCKRTFNGDKLHENIILIGACNPYRKILKERPECGLIFDENKKNYELVYLVNPLPFNLMNFIYFFENINQDHEKEYIQSILSNNQILNNNKDIKQLAVDLIFFSHKFIREKGDISSVSLREINRFSVLIDFFNDYYAKKKQYLEENNYNVKDNVKDNNLQCIILGIYICYYIRLFNPELRNEFEININKLLNDKNSKFSNSKIEFINIPNDEKKFIINEIELEPGIGKNNILKENIFLMFVAINTKIPLIICGKPGCSKSLGFNLIFKSMKGKYSNSVFFRNYPSIVRSCFQGSITTSSRGVINIFEIAKEKLAQLKKLNKEKDSISLIFFDELGLAEKSTENPLKVLHSYLEYHSDDNDKIAFIGISNWALDASKMNRAIYLYVPELGSMIDDLHDTMETIVTSINQELLRKYKDLFNKLSDSFFYYKKELKEEYPKYYDVITSRDFYNLIKNCANKISAIYNLSKKKIIRK